MNTLELFCGTKSFSKIAKDLGYNIFTIDNNPKHNPDICKNILEIKKSDIPYKPDIIWASPPCTDYSHAKRKGVSHMELSNMYVIKTLNLISVLNPKFWVLENPQTGTLKFQYFMEDLPFSDVDYCMYGMPYRKRTRLWNNFNYVGNRCNHSGKHKDSCGNGTKKYTTQHYNNIEKGSIPKSLIYDLFEQVKQLED